MSKITFPIEVHIPDTPLFLKVGEQMIHISYFKEDELRSLGRQWTDNLIRRSKVKYVKA